MNNPNSPVVAILFGLFLAILPFHWARAHGSDTEGGRDEHGERGEARWGIGVGAKVERKPYTGIGNKTEVLPLLFFENRYVRILGADIDAKVPAAGPFSFTLRAKFSEAGYKQSDAPILNGMAKRKFGFLLGPTATWHAGFADLSGELLADVTSPRKGAEFKLAAEHEFESGPFSFTPRVAAIRLDRKYVDYYYGVKSTEALVGRPQYDGRATINTELGLRTGYNLASQQMLFLDLSGTGLGRGIKNSPLVNRTSQTGVRVGYLYRF